MAQHLNSEDDFWSLLAQADSSAVFGADMQRTVQFPRNPLDLTPVDQNELAHAIDAVAAAAPPRPAPAQGNAGPRGAPRGPQAAPGLSPGEQALDRELLVLRRASRSLLARVGHLLPFAPSDTLCAVRDQKVPVVGVRWMESLEADAADAYGPQAGIAVGTRPFEDVVDGISLGLRLPSPSTFMFDVWLADPPQDDRYQFIAGPTYTFADMLGRAWLLLAYMQSWQLRYALYAFSPVGFAQLADEPAPVGRPRPARRLRQLVEADEQRQPAAPPEDAVDAERRTILQRGRVGSPADLDEDLRTLDLDGDGFGDDYYVEFSGEGVSPPRQRYVGAGLESGADVFPLRGPRAPLGLPGGPPVGPPRLPPSAVAAPPAKTLYVIDRHFGLESLRLQQALDRYAVDRNKYMWRVARGSPVPRGNLDAVMDTLYMEAGAQRLRKLVREWKNAVPTGRPLNVYEQELFDAVIIKIDVF